MCVMDSPGKQRNAKQISGVQALAGIVTGMSRFLTRTAKATPFEQSRMSLAEWSALAMIVYKAEISNKQLATLLGVSGQRVTQITYSLRRLSLITIGKASGDSRKVVLAATEAGRNKLFMLNRKLEPLLDIKNEKLLPVLNATISKRLMRLPLLKPSPQQRLDRDQGSRLKTDQIKSAG
jgi:DNA-binding MarR family transcriptional regulator